MKKIYLISAFSLCLLVFSLPLFATVYYVANNGNDANTGNIDQPFLTISRAQTSVVAGDTVYIRGGTYVMTTAQVSTYSSIWAYVTLLNKSGTSGNRINYWAYPGEKPVFDYSNIKPPNYRVNAFEVTGSWLHIKGLDITGVQVTITTSNTQSICFSANGGSNNIYEMCSMHDGMAIGFYLTRGSNNLVLNCDAYRNNDPVSLSGGGVNGGNVDGFGNHPNAGSVGNVFRGCRAWFNSDDGYDCISAHESTVFDNCWAFYNGYATGFVSRGDGNGFKAGGYGSAVLTALPATVPRNTIRFCVSVRNKSNGFYSNHHLEGSDWYNNTGYLNASNYNMLNRKAKTAADYLTDVPGYNHVIKNNISLAPRSAGSDITNYDASQCVITNNTFLNPGITVSTNDFLSVDTALLVAPRQPNGDLPNNNFLRLKATSNLIDKGVNIGFPFNGTAPDLGAFESSYEILPVNLLSFTAASDKANVLLNWQVTAQIQNMGWDIERSGIQGNNPGIWAKVGFVSGNVNGGLMKYNFADNHLAPGTYQYRLKQIDQDGHFTYSKVVTITIRDPKAALSIYPNPVTSNAVVKYLLPQSTRVQLCLYSGDGRLLAKLVDRQQETGQQTFQLSERYIKAKGAYLVKLMYNDVVETLGFIK